MRRITAIVLSMVLLMSMNFTTMADGTDDLELPDYSNLSDEWVLYDEAVFDHLEDDRWSISSSVTGDNWTAEIQDGALTFVSVTGAKIENPFVYNLSKIAKDGVYYIEYVFESDFDSGSVGSAQDIIYLRDENGKDVTGMRASTSSQGGIRWMLRTSATSTSAGSDISASQRPSYTQGEKTAAGVLYDTSTESINLYMNRVEHPYQYYTRNKGVNGIASLETQFQGTPKAGQYAKFYSIRVWKKAVDGVTLDYTSALPGGVLSAKYDLKKYDIENGASYQWLRADKMTGEYTAIEGATDATYTLTEEDRGTYIKLTITPEDSTAVTTPNHVSVGNVALGKSVTIDSNVNASYPAGNITDGNESTWSQAYGGISEAVYVIDLGAEYDISEAQLYFHHENSRIKINGMDIDYTTSETGDSDWKTATTISLADQAVVASFDVAQQFDTVTARRVRLNINNMYAAFTGTYFLDELEIYGVEGSGGEETEPPTITLLGDAEMQIAQGDTFIDPGATAMDANGNDLTASIVITGTVNTTVAGTYTLNYDVSNASGVAADTVTRTVTVVSKDVTLAYTSTQPGGVLSADYGWNGYDIENGASYQWLRAEKMTGEYTAIEGATAATYTLTEEDGGTYIKLAITPADGAAVTTPNHVSVGNVALGKSVTTDSNVNASYPGTNVTDGNRATWSQGWGSIAEAIYVIDLGAEYDISEVRLYFHHQNSRIKITAMDLEYTTSESGDDDWRKATTIDLTNQALADSFDAVRQFDTVTARRVRLHINNVYAAFTGTYYLDELEIFGVEGSGSGGDTEKPIITLLGDAEMQIEQGGTFTDPGATAVDVNGDSLTDSIVVTGTVNTATAGTYTLNYDVSNASGVAADTVTRTVTVVSKDVTLAYTSTQPGGVLSADYGWNGYDIENGASYQWLHADKMTGEYTAISGAAGATYTLTEEDRGTYIKLAVTPIGGAAVTTSNHVSVGNVALGKSVEYDQNVNSSYPGVNITDGNGSTWSQAYGGISEAVYVIDLGAEYDISEVRMYFHHKNSRIKINAMDIDYTTTETGDDDWQNATNISLADQAVVDSFDVTQQFNTVTARRVRLHINNVYAAFTGTYYLDELEIFGVEGGVMTKPVITLLGNAQMQVIQGDPFTDPGATAVDVNGDDLTDSIVVTGTVDTATVGTYTLTYDVSSASGVAADTVTRTVTVISKDGTDDLELPDYSHLSDEWELWDEAVFDHLEDEQWTINSAINGTDWTVEIQDGALTFVSVTGKNITNPFVYNLSQIADDGVYYIEYVFKSNFDSGTSGGAQDIIYLRDKDGTDVTGMRASTSTQGGIRWMLRTSATSTSPGSDISASQRPSYTQGIKTAAGVLYDTATESINLYMNREEHPYQYYTRNAGVTNVALLGTQFQGSPQAGQYARFYSIRVWKKVEEVDRSLALDYTSALLGGELSASYEWNGYNPENGASYQWMHASTINGEYTPISGATNATYTLTGADSGTYIKLMITPRDGAAIITSNYVPVGNIALGKNVTDSEQTNWRFPGTNMTDGDVNTWAQGMGYSTEAIYTVDLGGEFEISLVRLYSHGTTAAKIRHFKIEYTMSESGDSDWHEAIAVDAGNSLDQRFLTFDRVTARRVRLYIDETSSTFTGTWYIDELEFYNAANTAPTLILNGEERISVEKGTPFVDPGVTAIDETGADLNALVVVSGDTVDTSKVGTYTLYYDVKDAWGNVAETVTRTIVVHEHDTEPPVIYLNGASAIRIHQNSTWEDPGAYAIDNFDTDVSVTIGGDTVNTAVLGQYVVTYNAVDSSGNQAVQATRTVIVVEEGEDIEPPVITLNGDAEVEVWQGYTYEEEGATALDDGVDVSNKIKMEGSVNTAVLGDYVLTYTVMDAAGNIGVATRIVHVVEEPAIERDTRELKIEGASNLQAIVSNLILRIKGTYGSNITWSSSNESVIRTDGTVFRPSSDTYVTLTATITNGDEVRTKTFDPVKVLKATGNTGGTTGGGSGSSSGRTGSSTVTRTNNNAATLPTNPQDPTQPGNETLSGFSDMEQAIWADVAVSELVKGGVVNGMGDGTFRPNQSVTREEFVKMLLNALGIEPAETETKFSDVNANEWYAAYVATAEEIGIVQGIGEETFGVGQTIIRQDMALMIQRAVEVTGKTLNQDSEFVVFNDADSISDYAKEAVDLLVRAGILNGMGDGSFAPIQSCTRAEAAKVIYELIKYMW